MTQEAMKLALEALKSQIVWFSRDTMIGKSMRQKTEKAITALEEALAQPEQEPVAFASHGVINWIADKQFQHEADLYTTPPKENT